MKTLNIPLEDAEYEKVLKAKTKLKKSWRDFILYLSEEELKK